MTDAERDLIEAIRRAVDYWRRSDAPCNERLSGLAHSILVELDGLHDDGPSYDLVPQPDPDTGEQGETISTMLHELLYRDDWR